MDGDGNDSYIVGFGDNYEEISLNESNIVFKKSIAEWFIICKMIATAMGLGVLIYIGIRMALSTVASDQAKYKKMLISWVESMVILFTLQYIIQALIYLGNIFTNVCVYFRIWIEKGEIGFEDYIIQMLVTSLTEMAGFSVAFYSILFCFLVYAQIKFFWTYLKRFLMIGFLIAIAPLITITYSIDKVGDEKAQAFAVWFKELLVNIFIQPLHAMIYLVFIFTAGEIGKKAPLVALIFLMSMGRVEKMVKTVFSIRELTSLRSIDNWKNN